MAVVLKEIYIRCSGRLGTLVDERLYLRIRSNKLEVLLNRRKAREPFDAVERLNIAEDVENPEEPNIGDSELLAMK